jgi:hypothetical protein
VARNAAAPRRGCVVLHDGSGGVQSGDRHLCERHPGR